MAVTGTAAGTDVVTINRATGTVDETIDLSNFTVTNAGLTVSGDAGFDIITGGAGAQTLNGGTGGDTLNGGAGADVFTFAAAVADTVATLTSIAGVDTIVTPDIDEDMIDLTVTVAVVGTTVTGTLSAATFLTDMQTLLDVAYATNFKQYNVNL